MGKFHPHGDQSIYDALVRLAQDFAVRYPLVDGQGNFGNIDGDNAAAMRYTEARMTEVARLLLDGIDEDAVDFRPTYDGEDEEPVVLPGAFPNLLANGSSGIAVGMATSIPPHNAAELCDAALHLIKIPNAARSRRWSSSCPGPDFPTGGIIVDAASQHRRGLQDRPRRLPRARPLGDRGPGPRHLGRRRHRNPLPGAEGAADREDRRAAGGQASCRCSTTSATKSPRTSASSSSRRAARSIPALLMESLFKLTELESRFPLNMNVLSQRQRAEGDGRSARCCSEWLDHRREVLRPPLRASGSARSASGWRSSAAT